MKKMGRIIRSKHGQGLIELSLALPILLLLSLGAIEIANMIDARLVLSHLTREGASMISLGTPADQPGANNDALDAIIDSACPLISDGPTGPPTSCPPSNTGQWTIIYSRVVQSPIVPSCPCNYIVDLQVTRGNPGRISNVGSEGATPDLPFLTSLDPGRTLHVVEVFYEYQTITPVQNLASAFFSGLPLNTTFYERAIF